jgi:hypothetical protein
VHHYYKPSTPPDRVKDAARMKAAGVALGKGIYASLTKSSNAPGFVLMDELRRSNAGVIKAAAQYLAAQTPSVAGRWGTYVAHVNSYKQYKDDGVLKALRNAGARVVVEEYPQRLMIEGITQKERDDFRSYVNAAGLKFLIKQGLDPTVVLGVYDQRIGAGASGTANLKRLVSKFDKLAPEMERRLGAWQFAGGDPANAARARFMTSQAAVAEQPKPSTTKTRTPKPNKA